jgi:hypothetical protein
MIAAWLRASELEVQDRQELFYRRIRRSGVFLEELIRLISWPSCERFLF